MSNIYQSLSDGEWYCRDCKETANECTCPNEEQLEAMKDVKADRKRDIENGLD